MQPNRDREDLVRRYREAIDPPPEHVERERARLMARLAAEPRIAGPAPPRTSRALRVVAVAAGVMLAWALLKLYIDVRIQRVVEASLAVKLAEPPAEAREALRPAEAPRAPSPVAPPGAPPDPAAAPDDTTTPPEAPPSLPAPPPTTAQRVRAPAPLDADALLRESALLSRAREAQARGDWPRVLELVDEHRRSYARGVLVEERLVLEAVAACSAGQRARGQRAAQALRRRFPRSLALAQVTRMCEGTGDG